MRICFFGNPNSVHSYRWAKYFANKGHDIFWISPGVESNSDMRRIADVHVIKKVSIKVLRPLFYAIHLKRILKEVSPDVFHVHQVWIGGLIGAFIGFQPYIITAWGSDVLNAEKSWLKKPLVRFALNRADLVTCDAYHMRNAMLRMGVNSSKIQIICFGVEVDKFCPGERNKEMEKKLNIDGSPVVISLRSFKPIYDVESLINAVPLVRNDIPSVKFMIAGEGPLEGKLKNMTEFLGISESIRFVGSISHEELPEYLRLSDVYVSTSLSDAGISASTAEAMACAVAPVITDFGDNGKWVEDGSNGFTIPLKSPKVLAERIVQLIRDKDKRQRFGRLSREIIQERNNWEKEMGKMERLYQKFAYECREK